MNNGDIRVALQYHQTTKHSTVSVYRDRHTLDWDNQPLKYKIYPNLKPVPLPAHWTSGQPAALQAVCSSGDIEQQGRDPSLSQIAHLLFLSAGITKKRIGIDGEFHFRAAACAGALYPVEIYVICGDLPDLPAGVYHFSPVEFALRQMRAGDLRGVLVRASGQEPSVTGARVVLAFTAITWRSAWKYQARAYRYHYWDAGTILANALATAQAEGLPAGIVMGFVDSDVDHLLGLDGEVEKTLCLLPLGDGETRPPGPPDDLPALELEIVPLSRSQRDYPLIEELHTASRLLSPGEVVAWREQEFDRGQDVEQGKNYTLQPHPPTRWPRVTLDEVIVRRGSSRRFQRASIRVADLATILECALAPFQADWRRRPDLRLNHVYLSVHAVDGLPAGAYVFHPEQGNLELLKAGDFRGQAAHLCLGQDLGGESSVTLFFLANLRQILATCGNRGYRLAQMEAGIIGGKIYLGAYALGLGASGLTFYDDDVIRFFSPHAQALETIFVVALGQPAGSRRGGRGRIVRVQPGEVVRFRE